MPFSTVVRNSAGKHADTALPGRIDQLQLRLHVANLLDAPELVDSGQVEPSCGIEDDA